jgi:N-acyl-D-aspartate/D-glutamate deacylase
VALTIPIPVEARLSFATGMVLDALPGWADTMALPSDQRLAAFSKPEERRRLDELAQQPSPFRGIARWDAITVRETFTASAKGYAGHTIGEIAAQESKSSFDALLDIVVADELRTVLELPTRGTGDADWEARLAVWRDGRAVIGGSDAGAHLDILATFHYATGMLSEAVRERKLLPIEEAVHLITDVQARLYGLRGRGRLEEGSFADVVVFDLDTLGPGPIHTRDDLPAGASRLYAGSTGVEHVLVNGAAIVKDGELTDSRSGTLLRSGRDTLTAPLA